MSFLDRFKPQPRWKHTDPAVRLEAVPTIPDDDEHVAVLQELAREDADVQVRRAAGDRLTRVEDIVLLAKADPTKGQASARKCASCHEFAQGGPNKVGPNLHNILGRPLASHEGFAYSPAMIADGGGWTYDKLFAFLAIAMALLYSRGYLERIHDDLEADLDADREGPTGPLVVVPEDRILESAAGTARFTSGLRTADYVTVRSVVEMTAAAFSI